MKKHKRTDIHKGLKRILSLTLILGMIFQTMPVWAAEETAAIDEETLEELKEDPEYYKYYNEDGTPKEGRDISLEEFAEEISEEEDSQGNTASAQIESSSDEAALTGVSVTNKKIKSPFTGKTYTGKNGTVAHGIDVSKWQGTINWEKVKAAGVDYVIIRCGYRSLEKGILYKDYMFDSYISDALDMGFKVGVYIYSQATTTAEAKEEADKCIEWLGDDFYNLELPIVMDVEYGDGNTGRLANANLTKTQQTKVIKAFSDEIQAAGGTSAYYVSASMTKYNLNPDTLEDAGCGLWVARVNTTLNDSLFTNTNYFMWQYAETSVPGISTGNTDVNFVYEESLPDMEPADDQCTFENETSGASSAVTVTSGTDHRPSDVAASGGTGYVKLTWEAPSEGYGYVIRRSTDGKTWTRVAVLKQLSTTSWKDISVGASTTYRYQISTRISANGYTRSAYTDFVYGRCKPAAPLLSSTEGTYNGITLAWSKISKVTGYRVYRKTSSGDYSLLCTVTNASCFDETAEYGIGYTYRVRAYVDLPDGKRVYGCYSADTAKARQPVAPKMVSAEAENTNSIHIIWTPVTEAVGYRIYRKAEGGSYSYMANITAQDSGTLLEYTDTTAKLGVTYSYRVRCYVKLEDKSKVYSEYADPVTAHTIPSVVKLKSLTPSGFNALTLKWTAVDGADGYYVQRVNADGTRTKVADVGANVTRYWISGLTNGTKYTFTVRAYVVRNSKKIFGEVKALGISARTTTPKTTVTLSSTSSGKVRVSWTKVPGASGYEIYYKTSSNGTRKTLAAVGKTVFAKKVSGTAGKYRYYTVRAYKIVNKKKVYSKCSWQKIKVKA